MIISVGWFYVGPLTLLFHLGFQEMLWTFLHPFIADLRLLVMSIVYWYCSCCQTFIFLLLCITTFTNAIKIEKQIKNVIIIFSLFAALNCFTFLLVYWLLCELWGVFLQFYRFLWHLAATRLLSLFFRVHVFLLYKIQ